MRRRLLARLRPLLELAHNSRTYPLTVGGLAFFATFGAGVFFAPLMVLAVLLDRRRWLAMGFCAAIGSTAASVLLFLLFRWLGLGLLTVIAPNLPQSAEWARSTAWLQDYGAPALLLVAAIPFPQMPALIVAALAGLPLGPVALALLAGKLAKCGAYAWVTATFPHRVVAMLRRRQPNLEIP